MDDATRVQFKRLFAGAVLMLVGIEVVQMGGMNRNLTTLALYAVIFGAGVFAHGYFTPTSQSTRNERE
ncbi:hypothetical protein NP511_14390 [Natrinema thermotolerans]|uniref:Uncharacterized protein n=1 Tax=Natrinema thermotolerans TaxID=121872 RepID=A0AAF0SXX7_9EURY|nr:hypothetical protein [Natrinema thermotolerans]QCC59593.1 hypothetical protein DVR14_13530 [Natrinema thermotolerans]WMT06571.1 hypothetical protein NP511_14390 [Natrinema thermotolerans]